METPVLRGLARWILLLMLLFSLYLFYRGHNLPGGGFIGGLVAASGFHVYALAFGVGRARALLPLAPPELAALGVVVALLSGFPAFWHGLPFLAGLWVEILGQKLGTPLLFDLGVYLGVVGAVLAVLWAQEEEGVRK
ncbi:MULTISPECIES: MnhB domain-containing protein [Thermus]|uniref:MnhB domain-containing protein n=1 Tax=Thermus TaxID=270 RepID=UPI0003A057D3|nr:MULTISPECIES: MnhB domain-containing protein [Thermus]ULR40368.1 Na(+)/H(+) antiporter subunit B [Thermus sp. NEB1569]BDG25913.1 Na(+)/H(+) antiporter subunit B [Thermus thermophilus]